MVQTTVRAVCVGWWLIASTSVAFAQQRNGDNSSVATDANGAPPRPTTLTIVMRKAVGPAPLVDTEKTSISTTVSRDSIENLPIARDPWAILQQVPGVLTDRINVGGNETGEQGTYVGRGSISKDNVWTIDGLVISDMGDVGLSPTYFDFDSFEEMRVTTGGTDVSQLTGGLGINIVTKRGTNEWHGSGRYFGSPSSFVSDVKDQPNLNLFGQNRLINVNDYGAELGGPIVKDRLWIWGSFGAQRVSLDAIAADGPTSRDFKVTNGFGRFDYTLGKNDRLNGFVFTNPYTRNGEGASLDVAGGAAWQQHGSPLGFKFEDSHQVNPNFTLRAWGGLNRSGFDLTPNGGDATPYFDEFDILRRSSYNLSTSRQLVQAGVQDTHLRTLHGRNHYFDMGATYRGFTEDTRVRFPTDSIVFVNSTDPLIALQAYTLPIDVSLKSSYLGVYASDTLTTGNLTLDLGLRFDRQTSKNSKATVTANPAHPTEAPGTTYAGDDGVSWNSITPRVGLTYALGADRKTLLRAGYNRYASQLGTDFSGLVNPVVYDFTNFIGGVGVQFLDSNKNRTFDPNETHSALFDLGPSANTPAFLTSPSRIDVSNFHAPMTDELFFGGERTVAPDFTIGGNFVYRHATDYATRVPLIATSPTDSVPLTLGDFHTGPVLDGTTLSGAPFSLSIFTIAPKSYSGGVFITNADAATTYKGASLTFNRRLSNRWMLRGNFTWSDWTSAIGTAVDKNNTLESPDDGGPAVQHSLDGRKNGVYINSNWSYSVNGLYQIAPDRPWGFNVGLSAYGRQGYPYYQYVPVVLDGKVQNLQVGDALRLPNVNMMSVDFSKEFKSLSFSPKSRVIVDFALMNFLNEQPAMQLQSALGGPQAGQINEVLSPRVARLGVRFTFK